MKLYLFPRELRPDDRIEHVGLWRTITATRALTAERGSDVDVSFADGLNVVLPEHHGSWVVRDGAPCGDRSLYRTFCILPTGHLGSHFDGTTAWGAPR